MFSTLVLTYSITFQIMIWGSILLNFSQFFSNMHNFVFLEKDLGVASTNFVHKCLRKICLMLYSLNWPNFTVWLPLLLQMLGNMWITVICCPVCDVRSFEINHGFLIKPSVYITKMSDQKFKCLKNKKSF